MNPLKILLVDDEPLKLGLIREWLTGYDCHITFATTYESAVDKIGDNFDLIVCDYFLHSLDMQNPGTGKVFKDSYCRLHSNTIFILYSGDKSLISDPAIRVECVDVTEESLRKTILAKIVILCEPKNDYEKPVDNSKCVDEVSVTKLTRVSIGTLVTLIGIVIAGTSGYAVNDYRIDTNESKIVQHCTDEELYRKDVSCQLEQTRLATARLEVEARNLTKAVDELTQELKRNR